MRMRNARPLDSAAERNPKRKNGDKNRIDPLVKMLKALSMGCPGNCYLSLHYKHPATRLSAAGELSCTSTLRTYTKDNMINVKYAK